MPLADGIRAQLSQMTRPEDYPLSRALRLVADALDLLSLQQSRGVTPLSLTPALLSQIKAALEASGTHPLQLVGLTQSGFTTFAHQANSWLDSFNATTGTFTASQPAASNLSNGTSGSGAVVLASGPTITSPTVATGMAQDGSGLKHGTVTTGSIAASTYASVTLTWATAFADANYDVAVSVIQAVASQNTLRVHHIESIAAASIVVGVYNDDAGGAHTGTLTAIAIHN